MRETKWIKMFQFILEKFVPCHTLRRLIQIECESETEKEKRTKFKIQIYSKLGDYLTTPTLFVNPYSVSENF